MLENHHCATLFQIMGKHPELLAGVTLKQRNYMRKMIIDLILSTDMAMHGDISTTLANLQPKMQRGLIDLPRRRAASLTPDDRDASSDDV